MAINWSPNLEEEVRQNVDTITRTALGSCPGYREFGIPQVLIDQPQNIAAALIQANLIEAIQRFEPRVAAKTISVEGSNDGTFAAKYRLVKP